MQSTCSPPPLEECMQLYNNCMHISRNVPLPLTWCGMLYYTHEDTHVDPNGLDVDPGLKSELSISEKCLCIQNDTLY